MFPALVSIHHPVFNQKQIAIKLLRLDSIHPIVNGNKYFKLKYNLEFAAQNHFEGILTFGGQYSNHIHAASTAANQAGLKSIGIVVGDAQKLTTTLIFAQSRGMQLHFVNRETYRKKDDVDFLAQLQNQFPNYYIVPEGGSNTLAVKGCAEIPQLVQEDFDCMITACGTGGTLAGLAKGLQSHQSAIGISVLKGNDKLTDFVKHLHGKNQLTNWQVISGYHFGGYAKPNKDVSDFIQFFFQTYHIQLEHVYTAKMMMALIDLASKDFFPKGSKIIALHTGGLQGLQA